MTQDDFTKEANKVLQNTSPDARRDTHEALDEQRRVLYHLDTEVLSEDPEMGLDGKTPVDIRDIEAEMLAELRSQKGDCLA